jgi:branched-chain amino acid transport system substrate-binding protein
LLAVQLALEEAVQGASMPFAVDLIVEDDEMDGSRAEEIARAFVADPDILAVIGPMNSKTSLAAAPIFQKGGLAHIATAASNPSLTKRGWTTFFRVVCNDIHQYQAAAEFAVKKLGVQRIAVVYGAGGTFSGPMAEGFRSVALELGAEIQAFVAVESGRESYRDQLAEVVDADIDLIFFVVGETTAVILARELREAGVLAPFFATDGIKPFPYFATWDYEVEGPYYTNVCADPKVKKEAGEMVERYVQRFGEEPTVYMAEAYDAANIILEAFRKVDSEVPTRAEIRSSIASTTDFPGVSGMITFDEYGDIVDPAVGIYKVEDRALKFLGYTKDLLQQ